MPNHDKSVLISGAGIAGPVLGWWLHRYGFRPTIVEKAPKLRKGGHPVDLLGSAVEVVEGMGLLPAVEEACTRNDRGVMVAPSHEPVEVNLADLFVDLAGRHVEIMRGELVSILYEASASGVEYIFDETISQIEEHEEGASVAFESGRWRDFAFVIGADGQHSNVRRLVFGEEEQFSHYIGGYISGFTIPNILGVDGAIHRYVAPGRSAAILPIRQSNELGAGFLFRRDRPLELHHDDVEGQKRFLRKFFAEDGWEVPRLLQCLDHARDFYFESFSQIRMDHWVKDRIALVGDAGFGPAPAVGGGTSLAVVSAYVLAVEVAKRADDPSRGLRAYEDALRPIVVKSRDIGPAAIGSLLPNSQLAIRLGFLFAPLLNVLPKPVRRRIPMLPRKAAQGLRTIAETPLARDNPNGRQ